MKTKSWWQKLKRNPLARFGAVVLIVFYIAVIFADFVAPYDPLNQQPNGSLLPPTSIYWVNQETNQFIGPHIYPTIQGPIDIDTGLREKEVDFSRPAPLRLFVRGDQYQLFKFTLPLITGFSFEDNITMREVPIFPGISSNLHLFGPVGPATLPFQTAEPIVDPVEPIAQPDSDFLEPIELPPAEVEVSPVATTPAYFNIFGTDRAARDVFSRLVYGGRISLGIGIVGISISFPLGLLVGGISGYFGGIVDSVIMRLVEVIMTIPSIYLLVALGVILPPQLDSAQRFLLIVLIISFIGWAGLARVIRGEVLSLKERTFVQASRSMGGRSLHIITRHILPQTATYVIIAATLSIPSYIVSEAVLSLIGLGITEPDPSWGNMLSAGTDASILVLNPWLVWPPAALIVIVVLCFNLLGDGLRDALDPRSLEER
ncbi:ABC transporter, permease protein [Synechococcus sp. PCC 7335]|uniref:ABC transporter permease n=1 Tax=Synechococcus sp. (strain ATCC 29403 / PCC 7335) TaxID=91464 RepID=UPI00017ECA95|nr:ABC transporter permease [Synechococcus sp. PCC 7335]EDX85669.1 ABC transporter, permease protein [Synechococcus sp. PCC 7335]